MAVIVIIETTPLIDLLCRVPKFTYNLQMITQHHLNDFNPQVLWYFPEIINEYSNKLIWVICAYDYFLACLATLLNVPIM